MGEEIVCSTVKAVAAERRGWINEPSRTYGAHEKASFIGTINRQ